MIELHLVNDLSEIARLETFIEQASEAFDLNPALSFQLQLALDEALTNVIMYAYPGETDRPILLTADVREGLLYLQIIDQGIPFDPTEVPDADTTLSVEERPIGGLGIFLIRQYMDEYTYQRENGRNIQTMIKDINKPVAFE